MAIAVLFGKSILLVFCSVVLLRLSGRKSLAQMTLGTTIIMISVGAIIVQPIVDKDLLRTLLTIVSFIIILIALEWLQMQFPFMERLLFGKPVIVIDAGKVHVKNLRKLRITTEKLSVRLRKHGISDISDVLTATIEPNGELGFELRPGAAPLTVETFQRLMGLQELDIVKQGKGEPEGNLFAKIKAETTG